MTAEKQGGVTNEVTREKQEGVTVYTVYTVYLMLVCTREYTLCI